MCRHSHLEFCIKDFHVESVVLDLLHANSLGLCFLALLVPQGLDFVTLSEAFDEFGPEFACVRFLHVVLVLGAHSSDSTPLKAGRRGEQTTTATVLGGSSSLRIHHEPFVLLLCVMFLEVLGGLPVNIISGDGSKVGTTISLDDHKVSRLDVQSGALLNVKDIGPSAFEQNNVQELVVTRLSDAVNIAMR
jgi:hypothetical protein